MATDTVRAPPPQCRPGRQPRRPDDRQPRLCPDTPLLKRRRVEGRAAGWCVWWGTRPSRPLIQPRRQPPLRGGLRDGLPLGRGSHGAEASVLGLTKGPHVPSASLSHHPAPFPRRLGPASPRGAAGPAIGPRLPRVSMARAGWVALGAQEGPACPRFQTCLPAAEDAAGADRSPAGGRADAAAEAFTAEFEEVRVLLS